MTIEITKCPKCNAELIILINNIPPPHEGKIVCSKCNHFIRWISLSQKERKTSIRKQTIQNSQKFCAFCGLTQDEMINGNFLTVDHQKQLRDGGHDSQNNTWVLCDSCHKLKNWVTIHARNKYYNTKRGI